jgi:DNA-directed RNA polymerase subunit M/transcription elongation factor TFIIS
MTVIKVDTGKRFSVSGFPRPYERFSATQPHARDLTVYERIIYKCDTCGNEIEFLEKDFKKHSHSHFTNLLDKDKQLIDDYTKDHNLTQYSFLDFYCTKCRKPVSVFFKDGYGGRHGEYICAIEFVLEINPELAER